MSFPNYQTIFERDVKDLNSKAYLLRHTKTGARVFILSNDDDNKVFTIGFRTTPSDDTGVAHIMEHSVLCGSFCRISQRFYEYLPERHDLPG